MVDIDLLSSKYGINAEGLKSKLSSDPYIRTEREMLQPETEAGKRNELRNRIRLRIAAGRENNIAQHKLYKALDLAWDIPFRQVTPTLLQNWMDKGITDPTGSVRKDVLDTMKAWDFNPDDILMEVEDPKNPGKKIKQINFPAFFIIHVPIIKAYLTIRLAKLMNDRKLQPGFKFEPAINNLITRLKCEVITSRIGDVMYRQYGYWNVLRQAEFQALHYSHCLAFPVEEWHSEEQEVEGITPADSTAPPSQNGEGKKKKTRIVREGLRYHMPHPTRMFWDQAHRISTFLTDTGCEFAGYWRVFRYRDLRNNPAFWNTDKVSIGATEWWTSASTFFNSVYNSCTIKIPIVQGDSSDREAKLVEHFYNKTYDDTSVVLTEYFEKLVPSDNGLGDYDYPVWFRFVVAGDDTIIYAAPLPYCPVIPFLYDPDEGRTQEKNASLSLEILPFQDHFSNLFSQYLLSVKQNLTNITAIDTDPFEEGKGIIKTLQNWGERLWRVRNFVTFSGRKAQKSQHGIPQAIFTHHFPPLDTQSLASAMKMILEILERVQQYSSQEIAQAASHELREKEVMNIAEATSTRLAYTGAPLDLAIEAMKLQLYQATMAYGQDEFYAQIPIDPTITKEALDKMGFTWNEEEHPKMPGDRTVTVKVKRTAIALESFAAAKDGPDRANDHQVAGQLLQAIGVWAANPMLAQIIGPEQFASMLNIAIRIAGFPQEFKLDNMAGQQAMMQQLQGAIEQIKQQLMPEIQQGLQPMMDLDKKQQVDIERLKSGVMQLFAVTGTAPEIPLENDNLPRSPVSQGAERPPEEMAPAV